MMVIGILMIKKKTTSVETTSGRSGLILLKKNLSLSGFSVGILAGYFGIGGGFFDCSNHDIFWRIKHNASNWNITSFC